MSAFLAGDLAALEATRLDFTHEIKQETAVSLGNELVYLLNDKGAASLATSAIRDMGKMIHKSKYSLNDLCINQNDGLTDTWTVPTGSHGLHGFVGGVVSPGLSHGTALSL